MTTLFGLYFDIPEYFNQEEGKVNELSETPIVEYLDSLKTSAHGDVRLFRQTFHAACKSFDFLQYNNSETISLEKYLYTYLLPSEKDFKWRITNSIP